MYFPQNNPFWVSNRLNRLSGKRSLAEAGMRVLVTWALSGAFQHHLCQKFWQFCDCGVCGRAGVGVQAPTWLDPGRLRDLYGIVQCPRMGQHGLSELQQAGGLR